MSAGVLAVDASRRRFLVRGAGSGFLLRPVALVTREERRGAGLLTLRNGWFLLFAVVLHVGVVWHPWRESYSEAIPAVPKSVDIELARPLPVASEIRPPEPLPVQSRQFPHRPSHVPQVLPAQRASEPEAQESDSTQKASAPTAVPTTPASHSEVGQPPVEIPALGRMGYLNNPPPIYPESALDRGLEGVALLKVRVLTSGRAESVEVQQSSGWRILDDAAVRTVRNWLFAPASRGGISMDGWATVPIVFKIRK